MSEEKTSSHGASAVSELSGVFPALTSGDVTVTIMSLIRERKREERERGY